MPCTLLDSLDQLVKVSDNPTTLHYDTLFNVGDYYLSTVSFRHALFTGNPIVPAAFLIHTRRYHSDHKEFLETLTLSINSLLTKQVNIVTDREFQLGNMFPNGTHLYCWNHIENDLLWYLKNKANCTAEEVNYFVNALKALMLNNDTEIDFDREWEKLRNNEYFSRNSKICQYFTDNLIPAFKRHSAIWILRNAKVSSPENGITNNASESMNAVLRRLKYWKQVPLDVIAVSLYQLCMFYYREITRSMHQCGEWEVKDEFYHFRREPSFLPKLPVALSPKEIVDKVLLDVKELETHSSTLTSSCNDAEFAIQPNSQIGLANLAISSGRVKLVKNGAWIVMEPNLLTPRAVTLFPKESCSCPSSKTCCHIIVCKLMVGLNPNEKGTANLSEMRRNDRKVKERPSGRKRPRKNDFKETHGAQSKLILHE